MDKIVVICGGGHAKVIVSILKKSGVFDVHGYVDLEDKGNLLGVPYLGQDSVLKGLVAEAGVRNAVIGLGQTKSSDRRRGFVNQLTALGYSFPAVVSPDATINEDVEIGAGSVVMDGVVINTGTTIGRFCIVNTQASVDHDCHIGNFVHIAPGATVNGGVRVGDDSLLAAGCCIMHYKSVGKGCLIGLGANIIDDCPDGTTFLGPAASNTT